jgi:hypothetical protein
MVFDLRGDEGLKDIDESGCGNVFRVVLRVLSILYLIRSRNGGATRF